MDCGLNGPAGQNAVRHVSTMWTMLDLDAVSAAAIAHLQLLTMEPPPVLETVRSKNLATPFSVQVIQSYTFTPQLGWNKKKTDIPHLLSVNGGWTAWSQWSTCSAKCDSGVQIRERFCKSPSPLHGGSKCQGPHIQTRDCNSHPCSGTPATTTTPTNNYKCGSNINFRYVFKSMCLHPQVHVHRGWCTWERLNVRHWVVHVHGCVWTWLSLRCSAPPPAMMAATAPQASTCSTEVVCLCLSAHATTRGRCMMLIQPCLMMPAITGIVSSYSDLYSEQAIWNIYVLNCFFSTKAHVLMVIWSVDHLLVLVSNRHSLSILTLICAVFPAWKRQEHHADLDCFHSKTKLPSFYISCLFNPPFWSWNRWKP